ncbi:hypothetical protein PVL29_017142 [Vitis rotundifolia]|uniref:Transcription repressor n=1 Tax=Vitis rotundifolia TaxID=103349 RepID=A0AA38Z9Y1_VITRO|nr:hypothetical protein PVL29_017142 [Vitis rotundifolia]
MGKKMKLPSLFKAKETRQPWQWPSCKHPKTLSFRAGDDMFKTVNSVFFDLTDGVETPESWFTSTSESASFSTESEEEYGVESVEEKAKAANEIHPFKESVVLAMESEDPYVDFRKSMEEMVESHGLKDWDCLEELLGWYLRVNGKKNHGFIVGAFVDLLVGLASCSDSTSFSSAVSSFASPISMSSSQQLQDKDIDDEEEDEE